MNERKIYDITIEDEFAKDGKSLEIDQIAFTARPAVITKGFAFNEDQAKTLLFNDDVKMRIAAPAMIPMTIYRNDEMGEYDVRFSKEVIEQLHSKLMSNLHSKRNVFNVEHNSKEVAPAYILEAWLVGKNPQADRSYSEFGIEVPTGTLFIVAQFTDRKFYDNMVKESRTGFSIEGYLGLKQLALSINNKINTMTNKFNKASLKQLKFASYEIQDANGMSLEVDGELVEGSPVSLKDAEGTYEAPNGDLTLTDGTIVSITDGKIVTVTVPVEAAESTDEPAAEPVIDEQAIMAILQPKFDEIYSLIAEVKALIQTSETEEPTETHAEMSATEKRVVAALSFAKLNQ